MWLNLLALIPLAGCAPGVSESATLPALEDYSPAVQARMADELAAMGPPCPRAEAIAGCSAAATMLIDYGDLRCRIRAARGDDSGCRSR